ncbi:MAG: hypothetical protein ACK481_01810 [Candidatus Melainabacteria bacterium]|jgi:hypothetical protein
MSIREIRIKEATKRAKELLNKLSSEQGDSKQWKYEQINKDIKATYFALKEYEESGRKNVTEVQEYLSGGAFSLINGNSEQWVNVKWVNLLECFKYQLEDIAIIGIMNFPNEGDDKIIVWLDHEINSNRANDIDTDRVDELEDFNFSDGFKILGGFKIFGLFSLAGTNDTWTFVWDGERQKWVLDFLGNDQFADMFTKTIGNSINYEGHEFKYPKLI